MDPRARVQLSFEWTLPHSSSVSFHNLQGVEMELAMVCPASASSAHLHNAYVKG